MANQNSINMLSQGFDVQGRARDMRNQQLQNQFLLQQQQQQAKGAGLQNQIREMQLKAAQTPQPNVKYQTTPDGRFQVPVNAQTGQIMGPAQPVQGMPEKKKPGPPAQVQELQFKIGAAMGKNFADMTPEEKQEGFRIVSGKTGGAPKYTGVKDGKGLNPQTGQIETIPVSPQIQAEQEAAKQKFADGQIASFESTIGEISKAIGQLADDQDDFFSSSAGATGKMADYIPGLDGYALARTIDTVQSNLSFDKLAEIKAQSKTGGGLGSVSERELALLGSAVASLDAGLPADQKRTNLVKVFNHYNNFIESLGGKRVELPGDGGSVGDLPEGVSQEQWEVLTPEQRKLWAQ